MPDVPMENVLAMYDEARKFKFWTDYFPDRLKDEIDIINEMECITDRE
jgi:hypothetical protein